MTDTFVKELISERTKSLVLVLVLLLSISGLVTGAVVLFDSQQSSSIPHDTSPESIESVHDRMNGQGTDGDPYIITNDYQLQSIIHEPEASYRLGNDIDASGTSNWSDSVSNVAGYYRRPRVENTTDSTTNRTSNRFLNQVESVPDDYQYISVRIDGNQSEPQKLDKSNYTVSSDGNITVTAPPSDSFKLSYVRQQNKGFVPIGSTENTAFSGSFDGASHSINGLYIDRGRQYNVGLFGRSTGVVRSLSVSNAEINGNRQVGILAGAIETGKVEDVSTSGTVSGNREMGGLAGKVGGTYSHALVSNTTSGATIEEAQQTAGGLVGTNAGRVERSVTTGKVNGKQYVGGIAGQIRLSGSIAESYASGEVNGVNNVGGIAGSGSQNFSADITNSYAVGQIRSETADASIPDGAQNQTENDTTDDSERVETVPYVGGLIGNGGSTKQSYWDTQATGQPPNAGGAGLNTTQMHGDNARTNMSFDFENTWRTVDNDYPELQWQTEDDQPNGPVERIQQLLA